MEANGVAQAIFTAGAAGNTYDGPFRERTVSNTLVDIQFALKALVKSRALDLNIVRTLPFRCCAGALVSFQDALLGNETMDQLPAYSARHCVLPLA